MIDLMALRSPNFESNYDRASSDPCTLCGKGMNTHKVAGYVHVINGGGHLAAPGGDTGDPLGDMGYLPVGSACAAKARKAGAEVVKLEPLSVRMAEESLHKNP